MYSGIITEHKQGCDVSKKVVAAYLLWSATYVRSAISEIETAAIDVWPHQKTTTISLAHALDILLCMYLLSQFERIWSKVDFCTYQ
jgi:hypothetical protein